MKKLPFIALASQSPRRQELMTLAGFNYRIINLEVDESYPADLAPQQVAPFLAEKKAKAGIPLVRTDEVLLTADTVVWMENKVYEKPQSTSDVYTFLRALSGRTHYVTTGVTLIQNGQQTTFSDTAEVQFLPLTDADIAHYISVGNPYDKAGAYGIQEWIGITKIHYIKGDYYTIMGLPVRLVWEALGRSEG